LEAQSLGRLRHPNIIAITDFEYTTDGRPFIVMELLRGKTLAQDIRERHHLPADEAVRWAMRLASALEAAHAIGIIHRDLSPNNVFLHQTSTGAIVPKLLDFGSALVQRGQSERSPSPLSVPTTAGTILAAPEFCAPEMAQGRPADVRTDIYQLGLLLYMMLTGRGAFEGMSEDPRRGTPDAKSLPAPPSRHAAGLTHELDRVVLQALAHHPEDRYQTITEFYQQLSDLAAAPQQAPKEPRATAGTLQFLSLAAFAAMLVLGIAYLLGYWQ
jgi:serine/threonine-protein kinase